MSVALVLLLISLWSYWRGRPHIYLPTGIGGGLLLLVTLLSSRMASGFHCGWMRLAGFLGYINTHILLSAFFFLVLTPYGLLMRLTGQDNLKRRGPRKPTYWIARKRTRQLRDNFERLF